MSDICPYDGLWHDYNPRWIPEKDEYWDICAKCGRARHE